jgi:hypothetical protein
MTAAEFRQSLHIIGWSARRLALQLHCSKSVCNRWLLGLLAVPDEVASWITDLADAHRNMPAPKDWRRPGVKRGPKPKENS